MAVTLAALAAVLSACGGSGTNYPNVVSTFPADRQVLSGPLAAVRITYDEEVAILNPNDATVVLENEQQIPVRMRQRPAEPCCIYIETIDGAFFPSSTFVIVKVEQGAVVNRDRHYSQAEFIYAFTVGPTPAIYVGRGGVVTPLDAETLAASTDIPTPGGRLATGIFVTSPNDVPRVFVQLASGGGSREALAHFVPGGAVMTPVALSTSSGAADLTATARTLAPGPDGQFLYAAYRDESNQSVRLLKIDMDTATEVQALQLSVPTGVDTRPLGLVIERDSRLVLIACADGATGRQAYVDIDTFTERDRDATLAGTQAYVLPEGAGPIDWFFDQAIIAPASTSTVTFTRTPFNGVSQNGVFTTGSCIDVVHTHDFRIFLTPLAGYVDGMGLVTRTFDAEFQDPALLEISDLAGVTPTGATAVTAMAPYANDNRFLVALNTDMLTRWIWDGVGFNQEDLDLVVDGVQGLDVSATLPGITTIGRTQGTFPDAP